MSVQICTIEYVCVCVFVCVCVYVCVYVCVCACFCVCVHKYVGARMFIYEIMSDCVYVSVHMCVRVYSMCVCVWRGEEFSIKIGRWSKKCLTGDRRINRTRIDGSQSS